MSSEKAPIVNTQQLSRKTPSVGRQRAQSREDMRLPGERQVKTAPGRGNQLKEGSFRDASEAMDSIVGRREETEDMTVMQEPGL